MGIRSAYGATVSARPTDLVISLPDYTTTIAGAILGVCLILLFFVLMSEDTESMKGKMIIDNERIWK